MMKKALSILLVALLLLPTIFACAGANWTCVCGRTNDTNFCPQCGRSYVQGAVSSSSVSVGDSVWFGHYPQTAGGRDSTPIEWIVLDTRGSQALLISRYALDTRPFHEDYVNGITWHNCTLRRWLNGSFMNKAFSSDEQAAILYTEVDNSASQGCTQREWNTNGGSNTTDKIFLLSYAEATQYFWSDADRKCKPTQYAVARNAYVNSDNGNCWWWLRSPGTKKKTKSAARVESRYDKDITSCEIQYTSGTVRPAMWVDMNQVQ